MAGCGIASGGVIVCGSCINLDVTSALDLCLIQVEGKPLRCTAAEVEALSGVRANEICTKRRIGTAIAKVSSAVQSHRREHPQPWPVFVNEEQAPLVLGKRYRKF